MLRGYISYHTQGFSHQKDIRHRGAPNFGRKNNCQENSPNRLPTTTLFILRRVRSDRTPAILVFKGERNLGRVPKLPRGP